MKKSDYIVRVLSVAPLLAAVTLIVLFLGCRNIFSSYVTFAVMLLTLGVLPLTSYPLQRFIPKFKDEGRSGQRTLAMIFAVAGYVLCTALVLMLKGSRAEIMISLIYLVSGILLFVMNKVFKLMVSGHGCGIAGPIAVLLIFRSYIAAAVGLLLAAFVCVSSVRSKRHTLSQFLGGAAVSVITAVVLALALL